MIKNKDILRGIINDLKKDDPRVESWCSPDFILLAAQKDILFKRQVEAESGKSVLGFLVEGAGNSHDFEISWEEIADNTINTFGVNNCSLDTFIYTYLELLFKKKGCNFDNFLQDFFQAIINEPPSVDLTEVEDDGNQEKNDVLRYINYSETAGFEGNFGAPKEWIDIITDTLRQTYWNIPWIESESAFIRTSVVKELAACSNLFSCPIEMFPYTIFGIDGNELLPSTGPQKSLDAVIHELFSDIRKKHEGNIIVYVDNAFFFCSAANGTFFVKFCQIAEKYQINVMFGSDEPHPSDIKDYVTNISLETLDKDSLLILLQEFARQCKEKTMVDCADQSNYILELISKIESETRVSDLVRFVDYVCANVRNKKTSLNKMKISNEENLSEALVSFYKKIGNTTFKASKRDIENCFESMFSKQIEKQGKVDKSIAEMDKNVKKFVFGQDEAISKIHHCLVRSKAELKKRKGPLGIFLFLGASGTGKTFLAKKTQAAIYGNENIIRLDMSEFADQTAVNKIFGANAGYIGYDDGSSFLKEVSERPKSVILLDEIEKAHPQVLNSFLHIFDEGHAKSSKGEFVSFRDSIIIITGNVGSSQLQAQKKRSMGFIESESDEEFEDNKKQEAIKAIKAHFRPEFLNRISDIVVFNNLGSEEIKNIIKHELAEIRDGAKKRGCILKYNEDTINFLVSKSIDPLHNGARLVSKVIRDNVESPLAMGILSKSPSKAILKVNGEKLETIFIQ